MSEFISSIHLHCVFRNIYVHSHSLLKQGTITLTVYIIRDIPLFFLSLSLFN